MSIKENIKKIKDDIQKYSPYPEKVKLIAVTKYVDNSTIEKVLDGGSEYLGENKVQVLTEKENYFKDRKVKWHFIGNLQKNKVKYIASFIDMIHSINKLSLAKEIDKRAKENNRVIDVLLEINVAQEESKEGYILEELYKDIPQLLELKNINIVGLMTMAPFTEDESILRSTFKKLNSLKEDFNKEYFNGTLVHLSMGMSNDYKIALEEGATFIRVGSKIFENLSEGI